MAIDFIIQHTYVVIFLLTKEDDWLTHNFIFFIAYFHHER